MPLAPKQEPPYYKVVPGTPIAPTGLQEAITTNPVLNTDNVIELDGNDLEIENQGTGDNLTDITTSSKNGNVRIVLYAQDTSNSNQLMIKPDKVTINDGTGPKEILITESLLYKAVLNQTGTNAPTEDDIVKNTIGNIIWTRDSTGLYYGTLSGAFTTGKTIALTSGFDSNGNMIGLDTEANRIVLTTRGTTGILTDGILVDHSISIEVYP